MTSLEDLLRDVFHLPEFRPHQKTICQALLNGEDALVVMPTGAGKSLCYQLPGLALQGTTLVISPLIALMEDQISKLQQLGLAAERIHSGRSRLESRQVCREYMAGHLDFLFIAPERLSVPGFAEFLAKRKPVLIAVDEAHCISHWGHDFRPDYRLLSARLPQLRPSRIVALTATATQRVQQDIVQQLDIPSASKHIHGFRRSNIAIEIAKTKRGQRAEVVHKLLSDEAQRPAIVYATSRRETEELAQSLAEKMPAAAYHAGMSNEQRDRVQQEFLRGELEVIVATIAFGMGVDKANIRTVIHTGLPGSVEGYYQEIGRAGRDGLPSRAVLLYSYADRRTHEYFLERDYPAPDLMYRLVKQLNATPQMLETLAEKLDLDPIIVHRAATILCQYGGARWLSGQGLAEQGLVSADGNWVAQYEPQRQHKQSQLDQMLRYAESHVCRMLHLVQHFGDQADSDELCGICDSCAPEQCQVRQFRPPGVLEIKALNLIYQVLQQRDGITTGQLFRQLDSTLRRPVFEDLLSGLAAAGVIGISAEAFEKNGQLIQYQRTYLLQKQGFKPEQIKLTSTSQPPPSATPKPVIETEQTVRQLQALRAWRLQAARERQAPAFTILSNRTLDAIIAAQPGNERELLAVKGVGSGTVEKFGDDILNLLQMPQA